MIYLKKFKLLSEDDEQNIEDQKMDRNKISSNLL